MKKQAFRMVDRIKRAKDFIAQGMEKNRERPIVVSSEEEVGIKAAGSMKIPLGE